MSFDGILYLVMSAIDGKIRAFLLDFGGVLAEEGFVEGLKRIAKVNGLDPEAFFQTATEIIHETGYVTGLADEGAYWHAVRQRAAVAGTDEELREEILRRFTLRPSMLADADRLRSAGYIVGILSDQTNWLEEIDRRTPFFSHFDYVFNSFRLKKSKRDPSVFGNVCALMGKRPEEVLFTDDNAENVKRAFAAGLQSVLFTNAAEFHASIARFI